MSGRLCPCGCGQPVPAPKPGGGQPPKWATKNCRKRANKRKRRSAERREDAAAEQYSRTKLLPWQALAHLVYSRQGDLGLRRWETFIREHADELPPAGSPTAAGAVWHSAHDCREEAARARGYSATRTPYGTARIACPVCEAYVHLWVLGPGENWQPPARNLDDVVERLWAEIKEEMGAEHPDLVVEAVQGLERVRQALEKAQLREAG